MIDLSITDADNLFEISCIGTQEENQQGLDVEFKSFKEQFSDSNITFDVPVLITGIENSNNIKWELLGGVELTKIIQQKKFYSSFSKCEPSKNALLIHKTCDFAMFNHAVEQDNKNQIVLIKKEKFHSFTSGNIKDRVGQEKFTSFVFTPHILL